MLFPAFHNPALLKAALTHPSCEGEENYQRLEYLGDSILGFVLSCHLFQLDVGEGRMTKIKSFIVSNKNLAKISQEIGLAQHLRFGAGVNGHLDNAYADALEAYIGALYVDKGMDAASDFIFKNIPFSFRESDLTSPKNDLQELVGSGTVKYVLRSETGPEHDKTFHSTCLVNGKWAGEGSGRTLKESEQAAAANALCKLYPENERTINAVARQYNS